MHYVLFETGSAKWIKLTDSGAQFHSSIENATKLPGEACSDYNLLALMEKHKIFYCAKTIVVQPVKE